MQRGRLKIFFGAAAGVGKTFAMLEAAREALGKGGDVVVSLTETHGRADTETLLGGRDILPPRIVDHRGVRCRELDLDVALRRGSELLLVDELAHSNPPGSRHPSTAHLLLFYLLGVFFLAMHFGQRASILASLFSAAAFAFLFAPLIFSFAIAETENPAGLR